MEQESKPKVKLVQCQVIYNNNEILATGVGNTRKQAERNASIKGYLKLK